MTGPKMKRKPEAKTRAQELLILVNRFPLRIDDPLHPLNPPKTDALADNTLKIDELLQLMRGTRPKEGDPMRKVYDTLLTTLEKNEGVSGKDDVIKYVENSLSGAIRNLRRRAAKPEDMGAHKSDVHKLLNRIRNGMKGNKPDYEAYKPIWNDVNLLWRTSREGFRPPVVARTDIPTAAEAVPLIELMVEDLGPVQLLSSKKDETVAMLNADTTPILDRLCGGKEIAQNLVNKTGSAYATLSNHSDDPDMIRKAADELRDALGQLPEGREMRESAGYNTAMELLSGCASAECLRAALEALSKETAFNTLFSEMNNMYIVSVDQRAIAIMRMGVTVRYQFDKNVAAFQEYREGSRKGGFSPRLLSLALGLYFEYLNLSGQLQELMFERAAGGEITLNEVERKKLTGEGFSLLARPAMSLGTSAWDNPMVVVIHATFGYRQWELGTDVPMEDGTTRRISVGDEGAVIGFLGTEFQFPGKTGERAIIRLESIGFGLAGAGGFEELLNPLAYLTVSGRLYKDKKLELGVFLRPEYGYILKHHTVGARLTPALTYQVSKKLGIRGAAGFSYQFIIRPEHKEKEVALPTEKSHIYEAFGELGLKYTEALKFKLRAGYIGSPEELLVPSGPTISLEAEITPGVWFRSKEKEKPVAARAVPRRVLTARGAMRKAYLEARTFMKESSKKDIAGAKGKRMAKHLASVIEGSAIMIAPRARTTKSYKDAIKHLRAGRLEEGMAALRKLVTFRRGIKEGKG